MLGAFACFAEFCRSYGVMLTVKGGGKLGHLLDAGGVKVTALGVMPAQEARVLSAVAALALQGLEDIVKGHEPPVVSALPPVR